MTKTLFLTLRTFSATGGIEKVCRILGKALYEESVQNESMLRICSMYDKSSDAAGNIYFPSEYFRGFKIRKLKFIINMVITGAAMDVVILSHINLLMIGSLIKKISPSTKIILLAHGIEVWYPVNKRTRRMMQKCDSILAVSHYTRDTIINIHGISKEKCKVLNNCLDPFLPLPSIHEKKEMLLHKYRFKSSDQILMTLTRLSSKERYKGYDQVLKAIPHLKEKFPCIKYLIAGSFDDEEKLYVDTLVSQLDISDSILMTGYLQDEDLESHFALSSLYVMPSRKEGFGIVFIEAMYYGLPVIAGNIDGSADALLNGELGQLVNPESEKEIADAIARVLENPISYKPDRNLLIKNFGYENYRKQLQFI